MNSNYAYVQFTENIGETDVTKNGKLVQLNYPIFKGETNMMSVDQYEVFERNFPDRVRGGIIKQDNLMNVINFLYDSLKKDIAGLSEIDQYTQEKLDYLKSEFETDGVLKPDHDTEKSINDLASKLLIFQEQVRKNQRSNLEKAKHPRQF